MDNQSYVRDVDPRAERRRRYNRPALGDPLSYDLGLLPAVSCLAVVDVAPELAGDILGPGDLLAVDDHSRTMAAAAAAAAAAIAAREPAGGGIESQPDGGAVLVG